MYSEGRDEPAKALPYYERALSLIEPIAAANRDDAELQRGRAFVLGSIADLQNDLQRPREGLANYQRALDILEPLRAADPDDQLAPLADAFMLNGRGSSHLLARRRRGSSARLQSSGNDRAQRSAAAADRHRRDSHAAGSDVREPCARHCRDVEAVVDTEAPARQLRARSSRLVASCASMLCNRSLADALEGRHVKRVITEMNAATAALLPDCRNPDLDPRIVVEHLEHPRKAELNRPVRDQR